VEARRPRKPRQDTAADRPNDAADGPRRPDRTPAIVDIAARAATIVDVAARAGVSKSVVSRVLRDSPRVSETSRAAVLRAARELGYRPNAAARTLVRRRSHAVGILVTDLHNLFLPEVAVGLDAVLEDAGYATFVVTGKHHQRTEEAALARLLELRVDGIVCAPARLGPGALRDAAIHTAIVSLTRTPRVPRIDSVVGDDHLGATLVVEHLVRLGHRRIAMVGDTEERAGADRIRGYHDAMGTAGLAATARVLPGGFSEAGGYDAATALLRERYARRPTAAGDARHPTAVFVASDLAALGVLDAALGLGVRVPEELSVVGYDNTPIAALRHISLSSVDQSAAGIGRSAGEALLTRIANPDRAARRVVIAPTLIARATSGPAPA
jgi:DNA-binding LacI/PurR family transcriptional regulator